MQNYAQHLAAQGRYGDSVLVHMNPREVGGLQALARSHNTTMTVNPNTGLPEAFNLSSLLPMVIGAGLAATGIGAPAAAMLTGAGYTAATGSLKKGLMAGLGAYGGAGLGEGLVSAGQTVTPPPNNLLAAAENAPISTPTGVPPAPQSPSLFSASNIPPTSTPTGVPAVTPPPPASFATAGRGAEALFAGDEAAKAAFMDKVGGPTGLAMKGASALASGYETPKVEPYKSDAMIRPYEFAWNEQTGSYDPAPSSGSLSSERYFVRPTFTELEPYKAAQGGLMGYSTGGNPAAMERDSYDDERGQDDYIRQMAVGGLTAFKRGGRPDSRKLMEDGPYSFQTSKESMLDATERNFAMGGQPRFLSGGGDGMSDSIPAMIGSRQPARLADGEFVVPADVVSHIGNGSSKAGAEKLYGMMDKVREKRTGKKKQAPAIKAEKYMPA